MTNTKIFIISSAKQNTAGRTDIETFFLRLNNCYVNRNLYFTPVFCEDLSDDGSQKTEVESSGIAFFISGPETDVSLQETYNYARDSFNKTGKPKISVFIKTGGSASAGRGAPGSLSGLDAGYYYNIYNHIDTLKLGILMQIKQLDLNGVDIRLKDGKAWQGGEALLSLENVEAVAGYEELHALKQKYAELENRYYAARTRYAEDPDEAAAYEEFFEASKQRSAAIQEIRNIEAQLYHMMEGMYEQTSGGRLSKRQAESYRLIERGLLYEARDVLDFYAIVNESRRDEELVDQAAKRALVHINEQLQLKDINAALLDWEGVDSCYREAMHLEEKHGLSRIAALDYARFLYKQLRYNDGIAVAESLRHYYSTPGIEADNNDKGRLFLYLGDLYRETSFNDQAEIMLKKVIEIYDDLEGIEAEAFEPVLAESQRGLGKLYRCANRLGEAEFMYSAALDVLKKLSDRDPGLYDETVAHINDSLAVLYDMTKRVTESEARHKANIEILKKLVSRNPDVFEHLLGNSLNNLGILYWNNGRLKEAEETLKDALVIREKLSFRNPVFYERIVAGNYNNLGLVHKHLGLLAEADKMFSSAIKLMKKLSAREPDAFEPILAMYSNNLGELYLEMDRTAEAERLFDSAFEIIVKFHTRSPDAFDSDLATTYDSLGKAYISTQRMDKAEEALTKALALRERITARSPESLEMGSISVYYSLCRLYAGMRRKKEAEKACRTALDFYDKYSSDYPVCADFAEKVRVIMENLVGMQDRRRQIDRDTQLTPEEKEIALLLTEGASRREIARKLNMSADAVGKQENTIRQKLNLMVDTDPVIAAAVSEFKLTKSETKVLKYLRDNIGTEVIAGEMYISEGTVRTHISNLLTKLGIEKRRDLAAWLETYSLNM